MKHLTLAFTAVALGFAIGASATAAFAHGPNGHGKTTAEQCKRLLDPEVQAECLKCIERDNHAFFLRAEGAARCTETHHHD